MNAIIAVVLVVEIAALVVVCRVVIASFKRQEAKNAARKERRARDAERAEEEVRQRRAYDAWSQCC